MTAPTGPGSASSRPWGAALAMAASLLPHVGALVAGQTYYFRDFSVTFYPLRLFQARELAEGRLPAWNPYIHEGSFAMPILYPLDLLHAFWPGPAAVSWLLTLHFPLAALGAWWLARELGASDAGSAFAGAVYSLGGLAASSLNLYVFLQALALAPFAVGALRRAAREGGRWIALGGVAVGLSVTTLAVEFVAQAVVLGLALAWAVRPSARGAGRAAAAILLGAGLAAVPIAVIVGFVPDTVRGTGFARDVALGNAMHPMALLQVVVPELFGSLSHPVEVWWGGRFFSKGFPYFLSLFVGALPIAAAVVGWPDVERRARVALGACALFGLWFALGDRGGLASLLTSVPLARWFRFPSKALLLPFLVVALLSAFGCDRLRSRAAWGLARAVLLALAAIAALPGLAVLAGRSAVEVWAGVPPWAQDRLLASSLSAAAVALLAAALATAVLAGRARPARAAVLLALAGVVQLVHAAAGMNPQVTPAFFQPLPEVAALGLAGHGRVFSYGPDASPAFRRFLASGERALGLWSFFANRQLLAPYANMIDRIETFEAKDITAFVPRSPELQPDDYDPARVGLVLDRLRNAAVAHVMSLDPLVDPALTLIARVPTGRPGLDIHVFRLQGSWPRVHAACRAVVARDRDDALQHPFAAGFDPARDVALERAASAGTPCASGTARRIGGIAGDETYEVALEAGSGHLVVRQSHARGWRAWVDGNRAPVLRANGKHLAVPVGAGRHEVRLEYVAPGRRVGLIVTLLSLAVTVALLARIGGPTRTSTTAVRGALSLVCPACGKALARDEGGFRCPGCGAPYPERDRIIQLLSGQEGSPGYDPHFFDTLPLVEERHFWFRARRAVILDALKAAVPDWRERPLFDVGCGTGGLLAFLADAGVPIAGACDVYVDALKAARGRVDAPLILVDEGGPPPLAPGQRLLGMFDVLEHIDDDRATLRWVRSVLAPGGILLLTVPAHPFLFGDMDRLAHHRRRYRRRELRTKLEAAGFEVLRLTHFMAPLVPLLALTRGLRASRPGSRTAPGHDSEMRVVPVVNDVMRLVLTAERLWLRGLDLPLGSSLIAVARRPRGGGEPTG